MVLNNNNNTPPHINKETWKNKLYICDNLKVLNGLNSESVDLVYLDPPFNSKRLYNAPIGSRAEGSQFKDTWKWSDVNEYQLDIIANDFPELADYIEIIDRVSDMSMKSYITYMAQRVIQLHRILKPTGSIYYHCDPTAGHFVKLMLDCIFGKENFGNNIIWTYNTGGISKKWYSKKHDDIYFYTKNNNNYFFDLPMVESRDENRFNLTDEDGRRFYIKAGNKYYLDKGVALKDVWDIFPVRNTSKERTGYPTQKPLALLERIIKASCPEGGIVLDPFCGCATTCVASQRLKRKWIGIDIEDKAVDLLIERLEQDGNLRNTDVKDLDMKIKQQGEDFIVLNCEKDKNKLPHRTDVEEKDKEDPKTKEEIKDYFYPKQGGFIDKNGEKRCLCNGCKNDYLLKDLEIDHIIPKDVGGGNYIENYQLLCSHCNRTKHNKPMAFLLQRIDLIRKLRRQVEY